MNKNRGQAPFFNRKWGLSPIFFLFLLSVGILLNLIIPPFQNPDEPKHFGAIMIYAQEEEQQAAIESDIIRFMDENEWWGFVGMGRPSPLPDKLSEIDYLMSHYRVSDFRQLLQNVTFYHFFMGKILRLFSKNNIQTAYYLCRLVSFLLMLGSFFLVYRGFSQIGTVPDLNNFKEKRDSPYLAEGPNFIYGVFFALFLPQLLLVSLAVAPDALTIFLGSLFFFSAISLLSEKHGKYRLGYAALLIIPAVLGFFADRSTFPLLILLVLFPFFFIKKKNYQKSIIYSLAFLILFILLLYFLTLLFPIQIENSFLLLKNTLHRAVSGIPKLLLFNDFTGQFFIQMADSFLLKFGWMAYSGHKIFYIIWRLFITLSMIGVILYLGKFLSLRSKKMNQTRSSSIRISPSSSQNFKIKSRKMKKQTKRFQEFSHLKILLFSLLAIFIQILGLWSFYGTGGILVQGRHLFPLILPIAVVFLIGIKSLFDSFHKRGGQIALVAFSLFLFLFFNFALWNYIVPIFHLSLKGPHG